MSEASVILVGRIDESILQLDTVPVALGKIGESLKIRVEGAVERKIEVYRKELEHFHKEVLGAEKGDTLRDVWCAFEAFRRNELANLFKESLALVGGARLRQCGTTHQGAVDNGLCALADALINTVPGPEKSNWNCFTVLASGEFIDRMDHVIRVRFPETSIWNLPVVAHEFGHYAGAKLSNTSRTADEYPILEFLKKESGGDDAAFRVMHEYMADVFATYWLGPCYPCTCILLRFDPTAAYEEQPPHPSPAKRIYGMLKVLKQIDKPDRFGIRYLTRIIEMLEQYWRLSLSAVGEEEDIETALPDDETQRAAERVEGLYNKFYEESPEIHYKSQRWKEVLKIRGELLENRDFEPNVCLSISDMLNAAWLVRMENMHDKYQVQRIGERAKLLIEALMRNN
ncbi:MAG: hypothetical protein WAN11_20145 [Syntrophobacteraceae bacterium]